MTDRLITERNQHKFSWMTLHYHRIGLVREDLTSFNREEIKNPHKLWMHIRDWVESALAHEYTRNGTVQKADWEIEIWETGATKPYLHFVQNPDYDVTHPIGSWNPKWLEIARSKKSADEQRARIRALKLKDWYTWTTNLYL